jgi:predicted ATPase
VEKWCWGCLSGIISQPKLVSAGPCVAQEQSARLWELCAAMSLARLWCSQGKRAEAYDLLAPIYGWFTEGFESPDLKDAKALLHDLA